ncbi:MAG TPA: M20/M25/M40 family metallo-hydrolase [Candidatus Limnocylindrales bacterium]|nr:M20/M25/M40 family metallo-hydrolase [Candidatus Limnocylindrales bacterium]
MSLHPLTAAVVPAILQIMEQMVVMQKFLEAQLPTGLDMLRRMVEINSFTANPAGVNQLGRLTAELFEPLGFTAEFVPSVNPAWGNHLVLMRTGQTSKNLALISHLDTVFPPEEEQQNNFHWQPEGDLIFGPGTHDIKGGTMMMWLVLSALRNCAPALYAEIGWRLFWNSSEECFGDDFEEVCRRRFDSGTVAALVFEAEGRAGQDRALVVARKGRGTWRITVHGRGAHAGGKHPHGANAIIELGRLVQKAAALTDYTQDLTVNVGTIEGGTVLNRVPHLAIAEGEFRAFTPAAYTRGKNGLLALEGTGEVRSPADGYACAIEVEILDETRPWIRNEGTDQLFALWQRCGEAIGLTIQPEMRGGLSDGNLLWDSVPTLDGLGPWGDNDHCSERSADGSKVPEFVQISSFVPKALLNCMAIIQLTKARATNK